MSLMEKRNRAVFIDRDGTIARDVPYCSRPEDFEMFAGVPEAIRTLNRNGFKVVVITNQSGVARGYFTEETLGRIHDKMLADLQREGARIDGIYYCPHHPDENCECRKPGTALLRLAGRDLDIDMGRSYMIGDMVQDIEAGRAAGCRTIFVTNGGKLPASSRGFAPDAVTGTFSEAVNWILEER
jgi:histidinol-phosphate phosphatase family protein